ncbi:hypothetical protein [Niabella sp.]|uniref:hypothetical protein n=1 Tax=Niabella sp. TaxID=1962976 RepID=UPI00261FE657|nr:hypothetical protein [Niabella sp.]
MGDELHITRKENWWDKDPALNISMQEWTELVNQGAEMRLNHEATATTISGETITVHSEGLAVWTAYSCDGIHGNHPWFLYQDGNICVKNPDKEIIRKMQAIAVLLHAKVVGDEGLPYVPDEPASTPGLTKRWWKFW